MPTVPFNDRAHEIIVKIIDNYEKWLVSSGKCLPQEANDYITIKYIERCASIIRYGSAYLESDERSGAFLFLLSMTTYSEHNRIHRRMTECEIQLMEHGTYYFRNYYELLRMAYMQQLRTENDLTALRHSGLLQLAAATLPGVREDIRRELRYRGLNCDALLVPDATIRRRFDAPKVPSRLRQTRIPKRRLRSDFK